MAIIGEAFIAVKPDTQGFGPSAEKGVLGSVGSIAKKIGVLIGGAFVVNKGFDLLKDSVAEARESNRVAAQTAQAIKSTGGAAKVSAEEIGRLSDALARKTGIDDEQIQSASNMLLTFTNIRNEAGKGNDIFNQSTSILADMSKVFKTDVSGAAVQLGKALNDPIKGISALTRVGVTFSDQQKDQIKNFVETGRVADAQKVILAELNKEFGGQAAAQATASDRLKVTIGNIKEQIGNVLIPIIDKVAGFLADRLPGAIDAIGRVFGRLQPIMARVGDAIRLFFSGFRDSAGDPSLLTDFARRFVEIGQTVRKVFDTVIPIVEKVAKFIGDHLVGSIQAVVVAFGLLAGPIAGPIALLALLYARFQIVRDVVGSVVEAVGKFVDFFRSSVIPVVETVVETVGEQFSHLVEAVSTRMDAIQEAIGHVLEAIKVIVAVALAPIILAWKLFGDQILQVVGIAFEQVKNVIDTAVRIIRDVIDVVLALINGDWGAAWDALKDIPAAILGFIVESVGNAMQVLGVVISRGVELAVGFIASIPGRLLGLVGGILSAATRIGSAIMDGIGNGLSAAAGFAGDVAASVLKAIKNLINKQVIDRLNDGIPDSLGAGPFKISLPKNPIPRLAAGALVPARPGGIIANIAEGTHDEGVLPLPDGVIEGLQAIAAGARTRNASGVFRDLVIQGATVDAADRTAIAVVRELRAEAYRQGA